MKQLDDTIATLAFRQFGVVSRKQLLRLGLGHDAINYRARRGRLLRVHAGVFRLAGTPITFEQLLLAALLAAGPGAAVSHRAAGKYWKLEGLRAGRPEISVPSCRKVRLKGVVVHRTNLGPRDVVKRGPLVITTPARAICDLAEWLTPDTLEDAMDDGLRRKLFTIASLMRQIEGRTRNTTTLRRLLAERGDGRVTGSGKENALRRLFRRARLPKPVAQYVVSDAAGRFMGQVDFAYPDERLAIEYDGGHHRDSRQWRSDLARQNRIINAGWRILRYTHDDLVRRPGEVVAEVQAALRN